MECVRHGKEINTETLSPLLLYGNNEEFTDVLPGICDDIEQGFLDLFLPQQDTNLLDFVIKDNGNNKNIKTPTKKSGRIRLSAMERRAKHRDVVRKSYHAKKLILMELKSTAERLQDQFRALSLQKKNKLNLFQNNNKQNERLLLDAEINTLRQESMKLQQVKTRYTEHARAIQDTLENLSYSTEKGHVGKRSYIQVNNQTSSVDPNSFSAVDRQAQQEVGYVPLSIQTVHQMVNCTYESIIKFTLSGRNVSSRACFMGWEDKRLVDEVDQTTVKFSLRKGFPHQSCDALMTKTWQCFSDPVCAHQKFRGMLELQILQRVNEDTIIALRDTISSDQTKVFRCVYLLFRVRTSHGYLIGTKSLENFQLNETESRVTRHGLEIQRVDMFVWFLFNRKVGKPGVEVEYGGCSNYREKKHVATLITQILSTALLWEMFMVGPLFKLPPSTMTETADPASQKKE